MPMIFNFAALTAEHQAFIATLEAMGEPAVAATVNAETWGTSARSPLHGLIIGRRSANSKLDRRFKCQ